MSRKIKDFHIDELLVDLVESAKDLSSAGLVAQLGAVAKKYDEAHPDCTIKMHMDGNQKMIDLVIKEIKRRCKEAR